MKNVRLLIAALFISGYAFAQVDLVSDLTPGGAGSSIYWLTRFNGATYFWAKRYLSTGAKWGIFKTDGTNAGTSVVYESDSVEITQYTGQLAVCDSKIYFVGKNNILWVSDGTTAGTHSIQQFYRNGALQVIGDLSPAANDNLFIRIGNVGLARVNMLSSSIDTFYNQNGTCDILFSRGGLAFTHYNPYTPSTETGLYDLTHSKFLLTKSIDSFVYKKPAGALKCAQFLNDSELIVVGAGSTNPVIKARIFKYNLLTDSKQVLATEMEGSGLTGSDMPRADNGKLFFSYQRYLTGVLDSFGLYVTDGTAGGTTLIDIPASVDYATADQLTHIGNKALYVINFARSYSGDYELWSTDGTNQGTQKLAQATAPGSDMFINFEASLGTRAGDTLNGEFYFVNNSNQIWKTDGTAVGTMQFCDDSVITVPGCMLNNDGELYFTARNPQVSSELWSTNGANCIVNLLTSVPNIEPNPLQVYPNPASESITINIPDLVTGARLTLLSVEDKVLLQSDPAEGSHYILSVSNLASGIYILKLEANSGVYATRISVQR